MHRKTKKRGDTGMYETPNSQTINSLKKELCELLIKNNYNLLAPEVLALSIKLDQKLLPIFKNQLDFYNDFLSTQSK